jgi:flavin reductase (DIM6/NTAB) family NADH-FMN oxidoreductase RutF
LLALRRLGVVAGPGQDEFSAAGLHRHRHGEAWIA